MDLARPGGAYWQRLFTIHKADFLYFLFFFFYFKHQIISAWQGGKWAFFWYSLVRLLTFPETHVSKKKHTVNRNLNYSCVGETGEGVSTPACSRKAQAF